MMIIIIIITATSCAYHVQHVTCHVVRRDSSASRCDRVEIAFILALFFMAKTIHL